MNYGLNYELRIMSSKFLSRYTSVFMNDTIQNLHI